MWLWRFFAAPLSDAHGALLAFVSVSVSWFRFTVHVTSLMSLYSVGITRLLAWSPPGAVSRSSENDVLVQFYHSTSERIESE